VDAGHPFPFLGNLRLNLMVMFKESPTNMDAQPYAFVDVPSVLQRLIRIMDEKGKKEHHFVLLEELIRSSIGHLFPGMKITNCVPFRVTRNQDYDLHEDAVLDLLKSVRPNQGPFQQNRRPT
jgi:polyphosphate kinase